MKDQDQQPSETRDVVLPPKMNCGKCKSQLKVLWRDGAWHVDANGTWLQPDRIDNPGTCLCSRCWRDQEYELRKKRQVEDFKASTPQPPPIRCAICGGAIDAVIEWTEQRDMWRGDTKYVPHWKYECGEEYCNPEFHTPVCKECAASQRRLREEEERRAAEATKQAEISRRKVEYVKEVDRAIAKFRAGFLPVFAGACVGDFEEKRRAALLSWLDDTERWDLYLWGPPGGGKTRAAYAAADEWFRRRVEAYKTKIAACTTDYPPSFDTPPPLIRRVPDLVEELRRASLAKPAEGDKSSLLDRVCRLPTLLVLDDLCKDRPTAFAFEKLHCIVDYRWAHRLPTVVTCNRALKDVATLMPDSSLASRLGAGRVLHFTGKDWRLDKQRSP